MITMDWQVQWHETEWQEDSMILVDFRNRLVDVGDDVDYINVAGRYTRVTVTGISRPYVQVCEMGCDGNRWHVAPEDVGCRFISQAELLLLDRLAREDGAPVA